ncbi:hypothetical protein J2X55_003386 [Microbacterium sp. 1154]|uniref:hypothetical protein n=1 Tax=Microbacterium sp. 1154 TaxID=2817733 RepID=UPI000E27CFCB|nr:hypothetical protein [Microbacterium sp. 1154]MDR6692442.1 hypothetical protein [Microbacterium sp. 1154]
MSTTPPPPEPYQPPVARADASGPTPSGYPAPSAPAYVPPASAKERGSNKLGLIAFVVSLIAVVGGSIIAFIAGMQSAALAPYADAGQQVDPGALPPDVQQAAALFGILTVVAFAVYALFGLWGFVQGIVAAVKNRGRGWAIGAIVLSVLGGIVVGIALAAGAAVGVSV